MSAIEGDISHRAILFSFNASNYAISLKLFQCGRRLLTVKMAHFDLSD